jgi:aspartate-semialdehyde dehydrogenase
MRDARIGVVGATGAVGRVTLALLAERGYANVRAFASSRSAGTRVGDHAVEEATPEALSAGDLDLCFFSVGTSASRELVPHALRGGALCIDKSAAFRLEDGVPLVVPEVNGARAAEHDGIVANPNCCTIPLTCALKPLHDAAGLVRVRVATYQSASGAGAERMEALRAMKPADADLAMDWSFDGEEFEDESKLRAETRKILELPDLPFSATCVRVPVLIGHAEAVWVETEEPLAPERARAALVSARSAARGLPHPRRRGRDGRRARRANSPRPRSRERARPLRGLRQPAQGRRVERDSDRRARPRARARARQKPLILPKRRPKARPAARKRFAPRLK